MLWFAKMRFGKTLSALQVVKEHEFTRTLILTHRPVVDKVGLRTLGRYSMMLRSIRMVPKIKEISLPH